MFLPGVRNVNKSLLLLPVGILSLLVDCPGLATDAEVKAKTPDQLPKIISPIPNLSDIQLPTTNAELLTIL